MATDRGLRHTGKSIPTAFGARARRPAGAGGPATFTLCADLNAHLFPEIETHLAAFRLANGARVCFMIPLSFPCAIRNCPFPVCRRFDVWLRARARCADELICMFHTVAQDVRAWLGEHMPDTRCR